VVAVTGGGAGIGRAFAALAAAGGASVVILESSPELGNKTAQMIEGSGGTIRFIETDVTVERQVGAAFAAIEEDFGRLDVLHNNVGGSTEFDGPVDSMDEATWVAAQDLNLKSIFNCCKHAVPIMKRSGGGSIINMSSIVALRGAWPLHAYAAAKGGVISLTQVLASRYAADGIRVNAVAPGMVMTERVRRRLDAAGGDRKFGSKTVSDLEELYPFSITQPEEIATIVAFLASEDSRAINATTITADGGLSAY
jgi:NAD(P)-dependent dehydrogenase (short-subunit alcohol dehydrogenase family)